MVDWCLPMIVIIFISPPIFAFLELEEETIVQAYQVSTTSHLRETGNFLVILLVLASLMIVIMFGASKIYLSGLSEESVMRLMGVAHLLDYLIRLLQFLHVRVLVIHL